MSVHAFCRCLPVSIAGDPGGPGDVGSMINDADLAALYKAAGGTAASKLARVKYTVSHHTELGPQLVPYGKSAGGSRDK